MKACNYMQHATCAAHIIRHFEWTNRQKGFDPSVVSKFLIRLSKYTLVFFFFATIPKDLSARVLWLSVPSRFDSISGKVFFHSELWLQATFLKPVKQIGPLHSSLATIVMEMAEISNVYLTETQNYPFSAFISDTGGAAGLFLGLHIIGRSCSE